MSLEEKIEWLSALLSAAIRCIPRDSAHSHLLNYLEEEADKLKGDYDI